MTLRVRPATADDEGRWDAYVLRHPEGVAYQLFAWGEAVRRAYGFRCPYLLAEEEDELRGVLPLVHFRLPLGKGKLISLPYCDVGGVLSDSLESEEALVSAALDLARELGAKGVELRTAKGKLGSRAAELQRPSVLASQRPSGSGEATSCPAAPHSGGKVRMLLRLPESADALMAGFPSKLRSQVRKPERDGLSAVLGGAECLDDFYRVFAENMRDLGSPVHSKAWVRSVVESYGERARVCVVRTPDGSAAAGGILLCHDRVVSLPWASSLRAYNRQNPNMLLYWTFLKFAADGGYEGFDFGRSTPGEGTYRFKEQWGATPQNLLWARLPKRERPAEGGVGAGRGRRAAEAVWQRFPLALANLLGPPLRRCVSL